MREGDTSKTSNKFFVIALGSVELSRLQPGKDRDGKPPPILPGGGGHHASAPSIDKKASGDANKPVVIDFHQVNKLADTLASNPLINKHAAATAATAAATNTTNADDKS